jgi:hypothetical protein
LVLAGCAAIASLRDPSDEEPRPDASSDDAVVDARGDDARGDTGNDVDVDAGDGGADARPPCSTVKMDPKVVFCSDFEDPQPTTSPFGWTYPYFSSDAGGMSVSVGTNAGRAGRGARFVMPSGDGGRAVSLRFTSPKNIATATSVELTFSMRVVSSTHVYAALGTLFVYDASGTFFGADMKRSPDAMLGAIDGTHPVPASPGVWHDVVVALSRAQAGTSFAGNITIDGVSAFAKEILVSGTTDVWIGIYNISQETAATTVDFDDVVLRTLP